MGYYDSSSFQPGSSIGYRLKRLHKAAYALIDRRVSDLEITFSQWVALVLIRDGVVDTCAALADFQGHDRGATTRMLAGLDARGMVRRQRDPDDRRIVRLTLTPIGVTACEALTPRVMDFWNEMLDGLDPAEIDRFSATLDALNRRADELIEREGRA